MATKKLARAVILTKSLLALAFLLIDYRDTLPDFLLINVTDTILLASCLAEARSILMLPGGKDCVYIKITYVITIIALRIAIVFLPGAPLRIAVASYGIFTIMIIRPANYSLPASRPRSSVLWVLFIFSAFSCRCQGGLYFLSNPDTDVFDSILIQKISFMSLMLLTIFSLSVFLLLMEKTEDRQFRQMAHTDFLTDLYNRQHFLDVVSIAFERHKREKPPVV